MSISGETMKFKSQLQKNLGLILFSVSIAVFFLVGFYTHAVYLDYQRECSFCISQDCMDNNILCGDFGIYWAKTLCLVMLGIFSCLGITTQRRYN